MHGHTVILIFRRRTSSQETAGHVYDTVAERDGNTDDVYTEIKTPPTNLRAVPGEGFAMNECVAYEGVKTGPK